jgi:hypothetical protein
MVKGQQHTVVLALRGFAVFALGLATFFGPGAFLVAGFAGAGFSTFSVFSATGAGFLVVAFFVSVVAFCFKRG